MNFVSFAFLTSGFVFGYMFSKKKLIVCNLFICSASKCRMKDLNDIECVQGMRKGDMMCFQIVVKRYSARVFSLVVGIVRNRQRAEEIVSDVFFKIYDRIGDFKAKSGLSTWIYRIAYNAAISDVRKKDIAYSSFTDVSFVNIADDDDSYEIKEENIRKMERAVETLPPLDRSLVRLYYWDDKSISDIADITGLSESNVKTRLFRIRSTLKTLMKNA